MLPKEKIFERLSELGAGEFKHVNGTLIEHLQETHDLLESWGNRPALCMAGLFHAVYGTDGFSPIVVEIAKRKEIAQLIGQEAEQITYIFSCCDRKAVYPRIGTPDQNLYTNRLTGQSFRVALPVLKDLCELTVANELQILKLNERLRKASGPMWWHLFGRMRGLISDHATQAFRAVLKDYAQVRKAADNPRERGGL